MDPVTDVSISLYATFQLNPIRNIDPLGDQSYDWYARKNENGSISMINLSGEHDVSKSIVGQDWINVGEDNISAEQAQNNANSYFSPMMSPNRYQGNYHADKVGVSSLTERLAYFDQDSYMSSYLNAKNILKDRRFAFLKVAISQIGQSEYPGDKNNPTISAYHKMGSGVDWDEGTPWCSSFVNYALLVGNPELGRTKLAASNSWYLNASKVGLERVNTPFYGSLMIRSDNGNFNGGTGHVAFVIGSQGGGFAQLGGNQAVPGSSNGSTVNVVLRSRADNVRYYHFTSLPKIPLGAPLAAPATKTAQKQKGTDR